jgi:predicted ATPase
MVLSAVAQAVGLRPDDDVVGWLAARRVLLLLDNLEHLQDVFAVVSDLLGGKSVVLATSRAPLHLSAEHELAVEPLPDEAAVELFVGRAAAVGRRIEADATVAEVCRRLDNLPLAVELAAARSKLLTPEALLRRLDAALPLLSGGAVDLPERQRTLRATIEWSYDLLDSDSRAAFRRLSVFRGSLTLAAAEAVVDADLDQVGALLDQSLLKLFGDDRFFLLETIREYARERLDAAGEATEFGLRHARHYLAQLRERRPHVFGPQRGDLLAWFGEEEDNFRAALDRLEYVAPSEAADMANLLAAYWSPRGQLREGRQRIRKLLAIQGLTSSLRASLFADLAELEERLGDYEAALSAASDALELAEDAGEKETVGSALYTIARIASIRGDLQHASKVLVRALEEGSDDEWTRALLHAGLGAVHVEAGRDDDAREAFRAARAGFLAAGDEANDIACAIGLAELELYGGDFEAAAAVVQPALEWTRRTGDRYRGGGALYALGFAELGRGRRAAARAAFGESLELVLASERTGSTIFILLLTAIAFASDPGSASSAAVLLQVADRFSDERGFVRSERERELQERFRRSLFDAVDSEAEPPEHLLASAMNLDEAVALARDLADAGASGRPID